MNNIVNKLLESNKAILIGSRGFKVNDEFSDYDVAIKVGDLPENLKDMITHFDGNLDISKYFRKLPLGNAWYIPKSQQENIQVDWIVFEDDKDFEVIKTVMDELKILPKFYLENKYTRVHLFEAGLTHYGFIDS